jgi:predicted transcriptional regulator
MPANGARDIPPPLEIECLKVLWNLGEGNVKDVRRAMSASRSLAYTTVMTVLDRLARKGGVARRKVGRSFIYSPVLSREHLRRLVIRDLVDRFFDGSEDALALYLRNGDAPAGALPVENYDATGNDEEVHLDAALL